MATITKINNAGYTEVTLQQLRVAVRHYLGPDIGTSMKSTTELVYCADQMAFDLSSFVLAEHLPPKQITESIEVGFDVPDGWWQAFRQSYQDRWWMRRSVARHPIRTRTLTKTATLTVDLTRQLLYPAANVYIPELGVPVRVVSASHRVRTQ